MTSALLQSPATTGFLVRLAFALTAALLCALAAAALANRASAAVRHKIWTLGIIVSLLLPALLPVVPQKRFGLIASNEHAIERPNPAPLFPSASPADISTDTPAQTAAIPTHVAAAPRGSNTPPANVPTRPFPPTPWLPLAYFVPALLLAFRLLRAAALSRAIVRRATPVDLSTAHRACVLETPEVQTPVCVGFFRSTILLPPAWRAWPADQLRAVLTHELAHVARRDVLWQAVARVACALYWPHPLVWYAARKMRIEREFACDDSVVRAGASPTRYSRWLLDLACDLKSARLGLAMAGPHGLKARVQAALDPARSRAPISRGFSLLSVALAAAILFLTAALSPLRAVQATPGNSVNPPSSQPSATQPSDTEEPMIRFLAGRVVDPAGKPVPAARVMLLFAVPNFTLHNATTDADGRFVMYIEPRKPQRLSLRAESHDGSLQTATTLIPHHPYTHADFQDIQLTLKPAALYPITVTDAANHPVAGANIVAAIGPTINRIGVVTDAAGNATLRLPADNPPSSIIAQKQNVGFDYSVFPRRAPLQPQPLHFVLNGTRTVTVKVTDPRARPLAGVKLNPRAIAKPGKSPVTLSPRTDDAPETDATGTAHVSLPADTDRPVLFNALFPGYSQSPTNPWDPKFPDAPVNLIMKPLSRYHLAVLNPDGTPAPNADVMMVDDRGAQNYGIFSNGRVGPDGAVDGFLNPDTFYMFAAMKGKLASDPVMQVVHAGGPEVRIELKLKPAVRVHGRLTAGDPPKPLANASLHIQFDDADAYKALRPEQRLPPDFTSPRDIHPAVMFNRPTDKDGNFELYLAPGAYHLVDPADMSQFPKTPVFVVPPNEPDINFNFHYKTTRPAPKQ
jgi:beta-lactamase regulating signal transducer with metallopeptidase domain